MVMVNLPTAGVDYHVPFGGRKGSSYGPREQGRYAAEFYTTVKTSYTWLKGGRGGWAARRRIPRSASRPEEPACPGISGSIAAAPSPTSSAAIPRPAPPAKLLSENPGAYADAACQGIRDLLGLAPGAADPAGRHRRGEDGHHRRDQRPPGAQGRAHGARHHARLPRRARRSATRRARGSSPGASSSPSSSMPTVVEVDERVLADGTVETPLDEAGRAASLRALQAEGYRCRRHRLMHAYRYPAHEVAAAAARPRHGLPAGLGQPRGLAPHQAGRARRHHGGRRLPLADPRALCRAGSPRISTSPGAARG